jgi:hypothetical protein
VVVALAADVAGVDVGEGAAATAGAGSSLDAKSDGSIIGATHIPEYAESTGAVAHEPVAAVSDAVEAG